MQWWIDTYMINRYYHYICNSAEKEVYATIFEGLLEYRQVIHFQNMPLPTVNQVSAIYKMVLYDNPKLFYTCYHEHRVQYSPMSIALYPKYSFPLSSVLELQKWLDERVSEIS